MPPGSPIVYINQDTARLGQTAFSIIRAIIGVSVLTGVVLTVRWGGKAFLGESAKARSWVSKRKYLITHGAALLFALGLAKPLDLLSESLTRWANRAVPYLDGSWLVSSFLGIVNAAVVTILLLLLFQFLGMAYWRADAKIEHWGTHKVEIRKGQKVASALRFVLRGVRNLIVASLFLVYIPYTVRLFPRTRFLVDEAAEDFKGPFHKVGNSVLEYLPNLAYLLVILFCAWAFLKVLKWFFDAIADGTLVLDSFPEDWADPTYKLMRTLILLFVLMVAFPYLPGASSQFFKGFSLFIGALVTFGSSGAIGNMVAGIVLTYTRAFKVGDVIGIGPVFGKVTHKSLLSTRIITPKNEVVTFPNGSVLSGSVMNYSEKAKSKGVAMSLTATLGYETEWRTIHKLMCEGAKRTKYILQEPAPRVLETKFGDYYVAYELRAWTDYPEAMQYTFADLHRNVLDVFNVAGVEIMTPLVLAHRDASELAVPVESFPNRPDPKGIAVSLLQKSGEKSKGQGA